MRARMLNLTTGRNTNKVGWFPCWAAAWIRLTEEIVTILTLTKLNPHWSIDFWAWYLRERR